MSRIAEGGARTYNQIHLPRKYTGKRRVSIYWTWSYPWESNRDVAELDNRFSTMTEVRRVAWPQYETPEWSVAEFLQGIAGTLELFHVSTLDFQKLVGEITDHPVAVFQRIDQAGFKVPIDEAILADTDTLMVFGLDPDMKQRQMEYRHHRDPLVPRQQRFGQYTRSLMKGLGVPVMNKYGLRPATVKGTNDLMPVTAYRDLDKLGLLEGVTTFNFHPHLPHYEVTTTDTNSIRLLARQPINLERPHPFVEEGNKEFNCFLWMPPADERPGDIVLADSTIFTTLFGVSDSLKNFWRNLATMRMG